MNDLQSRFPESTDAELLSLFQQKGDLDVLGELYARYMHLVYGVALKYLAEREDAQDVVMQVFEKLVTEVLEHEIRSFKSWLYVLVKNHCLMLIRSRKSAEQRQEKYHLDTVSMESGEELHPIDTGEPSLDDALQDCIEKLKLEQKQCIQLFYYEKRCYQEIAERLELEEKKVKSHLQNGKRNLRICLEKQHVG